MEIINLTPHTINMITEDKDFVIESSGVARVSEKQHRVSEINGIPVMRKVLNPSDVIGLPDVEKGKVFLVSLIVAKAMQGLRNDLIVVNDTVRNDKGQIVGCKSFAVV